MNDKSGQGKQFAKWIGLNVICPILIIVLVFILWHHFGVRNFEKFGPETHKAAEYGDSFGYVNALFSGLAFGGVIFAIILQTIELRYQRWEMEANREELRRTADANTQLVKLNTLSTLTQYYLNHPARQGLSMDAEYSNALRNRPNEVKRTLKFKLDNCARLLEGLYGEIASEQMGEPLVHDVFEERKRLWLNELKHTIMRCRATTKTIREHPENMQSFLTEDLVESQKQTISSSLTNFLQSLAQVEGFIDALGNQSITFQIAVSNTKLKTNEAIEYLNNVSKFTTEVWKMIDIIFVELDGLIESTKQ